jgi:hypothetical protein
MGYVMTPKTLYCRHCVRQAEFRPHWVDAQFGRRIRAECVDCGEWIEYLPVERFKDVAIEPKPKQETPSLFEQIDGIDG